ncbi:tetratricopeptide repeat protein [Mesorhizobium kowhaii]|uniref:CHAT domain-containing protein n=1 Tax=Mesorhizobium kowhaii TaxID=1300272 RepID=UPI0035E94873
MLAAEISRIRELVDEGKYQEAEAVVDACQDVANNLPPTAAARAAYDHSAGVVAYHLQKYDSSIALLDRAVAVRRNLDDEVKLAESLRDLGASHRANGDLRKAEELYRETGAILQRHFPDGDLRTADLFSNLSVLYFVQSRLAESEMACRQSLDLRRKLLGPDHNMIGQCLSNLGQIVLSQGRLVEAERFCREGLEMRERVLTPDHPDIAASLNNVAVALFEMGNYAEAEDIQRRVLEIDAKAYGAGSLEAATDLQNLAEMQARQRRFPEAVALQRRTLAIRKAKLPPIHPDLALTLGNLANVLDETGELESATQAYSDAIAIEESIAEDAPSLGLATCLSNFGDMVRRGGDRGRARAAFERALNVMPSDARQSRLHTSILNNLADIENREGSHQAAERGFQEVVDIRRATLPSDHPDLAHSLARLADVKASLGDIGSAFRLSREAVDKLRHRLASGSVEAPAVTANEARMAKETLITHLGLLASTGPGDEANHEELLQTFQMASATDTTVALSRMAERHALAVTGVGPEIARLRTLTLEERALEDSVATAASEGTTNDISTLVDRLRGRLREVREERDTIRRSFPDAISRLYGFEEIRLSELRAVIGAGEAVLIVVCGQVFSVAALIGPATATVTRIEISRAEILEWTSRVRASTDLSQGQRALPDFDMDAARQLRDVLLQPFASHLGTVQHLICVLDEPFASVPLAIYPDVLSAPEDTAVSPSDNRTRWFVDRNAITMVPSPASLHAIRKRAGRSRAPLPFIGVGSPKVDGLAAAPLPRAREQLEAMRLALGGSTDLVFVDEAASKHALAGVDLTKAKVIAFATHGLMSNESAAAGGPHEPALLLSGPVPECFLAASEIAQMEMDADWAILSACNTAAGADAASEGLSGIARAFFEAGARTVLISHWAVSELSTTLLLKKLFELGEVVEGVGKSERLRRAMMHVRDRSLPAHSHPAFWGAFSLVGEGWHH